MNLPLRESSPFARLEMFQFHVLTKCSNKFDYLRRCFYTKSMISKHANRFGFALEELGNLCYYTNL